MVQIIPHNKRPGALESFLGGLEPGIADAFARYNERVQREDMAKQEQQRLANENKALSRIGIDAEGLTSKELRQAYVQQQLKNKGQEDKFNQFMSFIGGGQQQGAEENVPQQQQQQQQRPTNTPFASLLSQMGPEASQAQQVQEPNAGEAEWNNFKGKTPQEKAAFSYLFPQQAAQFQRMEDAELKRAQGERAQEQNRELSDRKYDLEREKFEHTKTQKARDYAEQIDQEYQGYLTQKPQVKALESGADDRAPLSAFRLAFAEWAGIPESAVLTTNEEAQNKISTNLLRGISQYFPGRILQSEVESFLKGLPTLMNSKEGQKRVAKLVNIFDSMKEDVFKMKQGIVKDNKGKIPEDLQSRLLERLGPVSERITQEALDVMKGNTGVQKAQPGQKITREIADQLVSKYGNKEDARAEAKRLGYEF